MQLLKNKFYRPISRYLTEKFLLLLDKLITYDKKIRNTEGRWIALIRMDAIGDFILWTATAHIYKEIYPDKKIVLIANDAWSELAHKLPYWDKVISINVKKFTKNPIYRWRISKYVNVLNYSHAIQPTFSRALLEGDSVIRLIEATYRIGSSGDLSNISNKNRLKSNKWYTELLPQTNNHLHEIERNFEFISLLARKKYFPSLPTLSIDGNLPAEIKSDKDYFVIFPGASWIGKKWPIENFINVINFIANKHKLLPILCGSVNEVSLCYQIEKYSNTEILNLAGKTTLLELLTTIKHGLFLISNDTSAAHIASFVGTPLVCILGGGHYKRFLPYPDYLIDNQYIASYEMPCFNCNWKCTVQVDTNYAMPCIRGISTEDVINLCEIAIKNSFPKLPNLH